MEEHQQRRKKTLYNASSIFKKPIISKSLPENVDKAGNVIELGKLVGSAVQQINTPNNGDDKSKPKPSVANN